MDQTDSAPILQTYLELRLCGIQHIEWASDGKE